MKVMEGSKKFSKGSVYCFTCTHNVEAELIPAGRRTLVRPGQKCPRCSGSLDAAYVVVHYQAA
jgi:uncharacterized protein (UPF0212 family)